MLVGLHSALSSVLSSTMSTFISARPRADSAPTPPPRSTARAYTLKHRIATKPIPRLPQHLSSTTHSTSTFSSSSSPSVPSPAAAAVDVIDEFHYDGEQSPAAPPLKKAVVSFRSPPTNSAAKSTATLRSPITTTTTPSSKLTKPQPRAAVRMIGLTPSPPPRRHVARAILTGRRQAAAASEAVTQRRVTRAQLSREVEGQPTVDRREEPEVDDDEQQTLTQRLAVRRSLIDDQSKRSPASTTATQRAQATSQTQPPTPAKTGPDTTRTTRSAQRKRTAVSPARNGDQRTPTTTSPSPASSAPRPAMKRARIAEPSKAVVPTPLPPGPRTSRTSERAAACPNTAPSPPPALPSASSSRTPLPSIDDNDEYCAVCGHLGNVLCCLYCVQSYHFSCLSHLTVPSLDDIPDSWQCSDAGHRCITRTIPRKATDALPSDLLSAFRWKSKATRHAGGIRHYSSFTRCGEAYNLRDTVLLLTPPGPDRVAEIDAAWEDVHGDRWMTVRWYWRPEETRHGRLSHHREEELFATAHVAEVEVDSIQAKVTVLGEAEYDRRMERGEVDDCVFMCRQRYDHDRGVYRSIVPDPSAGTGGPEGGQEGVWKPDGAGGRVRKRVAEVDPSASVYSRACAALQLSALPDSLPCREVEEAQVRSFLTSSIRRGEQQGGGLYIAGVPGTGKTATVRQVIAALAHSATSDADLLSDDPSLVPPFRFIEVNGMKLPDPHHAYTHILHCLTGRRLPPPRACALLDGMFKTKSSRRPVTVLLLDEIDFCLTRAQHLLYHLSDWPTYRGARLVVVSISNTIDFPTLLHERVRSRFIATTLTFPPYSPAQVQRIVEHRLRDLPHLFDADALTFCAKKIAAINGDVRGALDLCRKAARLAEEEEGKVDVGVVLRVVKEVGEGSAVELVKSCGVWEVAVLAAVYGEDKEESRFIGLGRVGDRVRRMMKGRGMGGEVTAWEVEGVVRGLVEVGLMEWRWIKGQHLPDIRLTLSPHLCHHALKDNSHWNSLTS